MTRQRWWYYRNYIWSLVLETYFTIMHSLAKFWYHIKQKCSLGSALPTAPRLTNYGTYAVTVSAFAWICMILFCMILNFVLQEFSFSGVVCGFKSVFIHKNTRFFFHWLKIWTSNPIFIGPSFIGCKIAPRLVFCYSCPILSNLSITHFELKMH